MSRVRGRVSRPLSPGWQEELPPAFVCVICEREQEPSPWHWRREHNPPICFYCANTYGHQVRIPGMTRGDHYTLQRLSAVADALLNTANRRAYFGRFTAI